MQEKIYDVPAEWAKRAHIDAAKYRTMYDASINDPDAFWGEHGKRIHWMTPFKRVKNVSFAPGNVSIKWFEDGTTNVAYNCIDRHLPARANQVAIIWEGDDPSESKLITYRELHDEVCRFANVLRNRGVEKGDRVTIYLPMIPEAAYAMLACARLGAIHSVVFGGFSPDALAGRIEGCQSKLVITADEGLRGGRKVPLKANVDTAIERVGGVDHVVVVRRTGGKVAMEPVRDVWYHEAAAMVTTECPCVEVNAEHPLFILYTSGSTGSPKGVLHTTAGYLVYAAMTHQYIFDYHEGDIYWCTADVGWVTGHSYILYGPLANGATTLMFEGVPSYPTNARFWEVIDKHKVNTFYTAPTAIRALMQTGEEMVKKTSRQTLRLLGSVGEPINPEAWEWYYRVVGDKRCPIVDTWWQTETGGILISPLPGATRLKPGSATTPFFGVLPQVVDASGNVLEGATEGSLVIADFLAGADAHRVRRPPAFHGDLFLRLSEQILHRRRLPARRRRLLLDHRPRRRRHQRVRPPHGHGRGRILPRRPPESVGGGRGGLSARHQGPGHLCLCHADGRRGGQRRVAQGTRRLGAQGYRPDCSPDVIQFAPGLPKTRSGKIMRRILRKIAENEFGALGDTSTLADPAVVDDLIRNW